MIPNVSEKHLAPERLAAFRALSDPARLAIVDELRGGPLCGRDLRERLQLSSSLLSHHLRVLNKAGLIHYARVGRCLEVELNHDGFDRLEAALPRRTRTELEVADAR